MICRGHSQWVAKLHLRTGAFPAPPPTPAPMTVVVHRVPRLRAVGGGRGSLFLDFTDVQARDAGGMKQVPPWLPCHQGHGNVVGVMRRDRTRPALTATLLTDAP